ncbi:hypothetical protein GEMRC1_012227 [Eukaryota sp. GEM-RC1]
MDCFVCCESFNLSNRVPLLICCEGHTCCSECSESLNQCPLCRSDCLEDRKVNFALQDLVKASRDGELCPQIPSDQIVLGDKIAEGGFAEVYSAHWFDLSVAIKMVSLTEKGRIELQREMNLLFNLNHPAVIRVFGTTCFANSIGIVMELASSPSPSPSLLSPTTVRYAKELCQAVKFLHLKSVVHGDLKPANVLLVDDHVRVADFGTSKNLAATTLVTRANAMSPKYAAPEQFDSRPGPFSDIYSLGLILYELLTGREAFAGYSMMQIVGAKVQGKPLPFDDSIPDCLKEIIMKCLNPDPSLRPRINEITDILNTLDVLEAGGVINDQLFLIDENESLKTKIDELSDEVLNLKSENSELVNHIQSLSSLNNELHDKEKSFNQQILNLETDNHFLREEIERLKSEILKFNSPNNEIPHKAIAPPSFGSSQGLIPKTKKKLQQEIPVKREVNSNYEIDLSKLKPRLREVLEEIRNGSVSEVSLGNNSIGTEGAIALAGALKVNSTVTKIDLWGNSIGNEGAIALADALKVNSTVTQINLGYNSIGTEGAIALADALKVNSTVTKIDLGGNSIGNEGAIALAYALNVNSTVTKIYLGGNSIGSKTKQHIKRMSNNRITC